MDIPPTPDGTKVQYVLDGQQRLTTLSLIIAVITEKPKEAGDERAGIHLIYLISKRVRGKETPKIMHQREDTGIYKSIIENPKLSFEKEFKHTKIGIATQKIFTLIEEYCPKQGNLIDNLNEMLEKLLYGVEIVRIKAP